MRHTQLQSTVIRAPAFTLCTALALALVSGPARAERPEVGLELKSPLSVEQRHALTARFLAGYDHPHGGWTVEEKSIDPASIELAMLTKGRGSIEAEAMAQKTLLKALALVDPVWGGAYVFSEANAGRDPWRSPRYEKRTLDQAGAIRVYALAAASFGSSKYLETARAIERYVGEFLTSPEGAFYVGQSGSVPGGANADQYFARSNAERRRAGVPVVDRRIVTRLNGAMIEALATLYAVSGDPAHLERAVIAAEYLIARSKLPGGGFRSEPDERGPAELADTLAAGRAMLELFATDANEKWLAEAEDAVAFAARTFHSSEGGYGSTLEATSIGAHRDIQENARLARLANLMHQYTGHVGYREIADHAFTFLSSAEVIDRDDTIAEVLLAARELGLEAPRLIIVGDRGDARARALQRAALSKASAYRLVEWVEPGPAPLRYAYLHFPRPQTSAAVVCGRGRCASPAFDEKHTERVVMELESSAP